MGRLIGDYLQPRLPKKSSRKERSNKMEAITVGGIMCLVYAVWYLLGERKARHIAKLKAEAEANDLSVERTITRHVKACRKEK